MGLTFYSLKKVISSGAIIESSAEDNTSWTCAWTRRGRGRCGQVFPEVLCRREQHGTRASLVFL